MKVRRFVVADIHGRAQALRGLLKVVKFDYAKDKLIVLGDVVDGGEDVKGAVSELLKIKNLIYVIGNHDCWFVSYILSGNVSDDWYFQGGDATLKSYRDGVPDAHKNLFLKGAKMWHEEEGAVFVHGGIKPGIPLEKNKLEYVVWDRDMFDYFDEGVKFPFKEIYVGHTPTTVLGSAVPIIKKSGDTRLIMLDTGAGWQGKLTIMNIDTGKSWQSETLMPSSRGGLK
jgi:serine/threonine protein phosphatase 1